MIQRGNPCRLLLGGAASRDGVINCLADCLLFISVWFWTMLTWSKIPDPENRATEKPSHHLRQQDTHNATATQM